MNRPLFFCVALASVLAGVDALAKPAPKLECLEPVYEFGSVDGAQPVSHTFQIRNAGNADLVIKKIDAPCGCTSYALSKDILPPGQSLGIPVTVSLQGRKGFEEKSLYLITNDPSGMPFQLSLRGNVGSEIEIQPPMMTLRKAPKSSEVFGEVKVRNPGKKPLTCLEAKSVEGKLEISMAPLPDGDGFTLRAKPVAGLAAGQQKDKIRIRLGGGGDKKELSIDALILLPTDLIAAPSVLRLDTKAPSPLSRTIIVRSPVGNDFTVESVELPEAAMTSSIERINGSSTRVVVDNIRPKLQLDGKKLILRIGGSKPRVLEIPVAVQR